METPEIVVRPVGKKGRWVPAALCALLLWALLLNRLRLNRLLDLLLDRRCRSDIFLRLLSLDMPSEHFCPVFYLLLPVSFLRLCCGFLQSLADKLEDYRKKNNDQCEDCFHMISFIR